MVNSSASDGILVGDTTTVDGCRVFNNGGHGIYDPTHADAIIVRNFAHGNASGDFQSGTLSGPTTNSALNATSPWSNFSY